MGKLEKIVVLSVLFLIALILVVSLTTDDPIKKESAMLLGETGGKTVGASKQVDPPALPSPAPGSSETKFAAGTGAPNPVTNPIPASNEIKVAPSKDPGTLLNAKVDTTPANPPAATLPADALLKSPAGLTEFSSERMLYTWQAGDTWLSVADRLYGNPTKFTMLKRANDDRETVEVGNKILVPIKDEDTPALVAMHHGDPAAKSGKNEVADKGAKPAAKVGAKTPGTTPSSSAAAKPAASGGKTHVVKDGESLIKISRLELGEGKRWKEIFDANKDKLTSPEALRTGMILRIP